MYTLYVSAFVCIYIYNIICAYMYNAQQATHKHVTCNNEFIRLR